MIQCHESPSPHTAPPRPMPQKANAIEPYTRAPNQNKPVHPKRILKTSLHPPRGLQYVFYQKFPSGLHFTSAFTQLTFHIYTHLLCSCCYMATRREQALRCKFWFLASAQVCVFQCDLACQEEGRQTPTIYPWLPRRNTLGDGVIAVLHLSLPWKAVLPKNSRRLKMWSRHFA